MSGYKAHTYGARGAKKYTGKYAAQKKAAQRRRAASKRRQMGNPYVEKKGMDTPISYSDIIATTNTNAYCTVLNLVRTGTGSWNRIGKRITPVSLRLRGEILYGCTSDGTNNFSEGTVLRLVVVHDAQPSGNAIPAFDDVFGYTEQDGTEASSVISGVKYDNTDRFTVIRDKFYELNPVAYPGLSAPTSLESYLSVYVDEFITLRQQSCVFSGQSTPMTITDVSTGAYYLYARAINNRSYTDCDFEGTCRFRYTD